MKLKVQEGSTKLYTEDGEDAFYNETQVFNRDFSMLGAHTFLKYRCPKQAFKYGRIRILDAMTATGLRALRYSREMGHYKCIGVIQKLLSSGQVLSDADVTIPIDVLGVDLSESAVKRAQNNLGAQEQLTDQTGSSREPHNIEFKQADCNVEMYNNPQSFAVIDLDPFGHPSIFFDAAIKGLAPGGLIAATATDAMITCGRQPLEAMVRYQSIPAKAGFSHEFSVRMVIGSLAMACIRARVSFKVLYSFFHLHYLRIFCSCKCKDGIPPAEIANYMYTIQYCKNCGWCKQLQCINSERPVNALPHCPLCQGTVFMAGPVWYGNIADTVFCEQLLQELDYNIQPGEMVFDDGEYNQIYDKRKYLQLTCQKQIYAHINFTKEEIGCRPFFTDISTVSSIFHTQALPNSVIFNYCERLDKYCVSSSYQQTGFKLELTDDEVRDLFYFWWTLQNAAGAASKAWIGPQAQTIKFNANTVLTLVKKFQKDEEKCLQALQIMRERGFIDDDLEEEDMIQIPKYYKEIRGLGLFQPNPEKGWGPKKMV